MSSGMAAISSVLLTLLADGGHLVASDQLYDLTSDFIRDDLPALGGSASFVDLSDVDAIRGAISPQTRAIYVEPFSNPLLQVATFECWPDCSRERSAPGGRQHLSLARAPSTGCARRGHRSAQRHEIPLRKWSGAGWSRFRPAAPHRPDPVPRRSASARRCRRSRRGCC